MACPQANRRAIALGASHGGSERCTLDAQAPVTPVVEFRADGLSANETVEPKCSSQAGHSLALGLDGEGSIPVPSPPPWHAPDSSPPIR
jgi:hypothetical protein